WHPRKHQPVDSGTRLLATVEDRSTSSRASVSRRWRKSGRRRARTAACSTVHRAGRPSNKFRQPSYIRSRAWVRSPYLNSCLLGIRRLQIEHDVAGDKAAVGIAIGSRIEDVAHAHPQIPPGVVFLDATVPFGHPLAKLDLVADAEAAIVVAHVEALAAVEQVLEERWPDFQLMRLHCSAFCVIVRLDLSHQFAQQFLER